jgi:signal transduction histidine kinase
MNERWCRLIGESFPDPLVIADREGNVLEWNRAAEKWFGLLPRAQGRVKTSGTALAGLLPPKREACDWQNELLVVNGKELPIEFRILPLVPGGRSGEGSGAVLLQVQEMMESARYKEGLLAIGQKFRHLNAAIRHDILNQLTIVIGFLQFSEDLAPDEKFRDFIRKEITAGEKIQRLVEFTREYQDIGEQGPCWIDCTVFLGKVVNETGEDKAGLTPLPDRWEIFAHPAIENAMERLLLYVVSERRPPVPAKIRAGEAPEGLTIIIEDYAPPVPPEEKNLIFERGHGNAGMDLWLAKELLSLSEISIREDGDTGGRFVITVPGRLVRKIGGGLERNSE